MAEHAPHAQHHGELTDDPEVPAAGRREAAEAIGRSRQRRILPHDLDLRQPQALSQLRVDKAQPLVLALVLDGNGRRRLARPHRRRQRGQFMPCPLAVHTLHDGLGGGGALAGAGVHPQPLQTVGGVEVQTERERLAGSEKEPLVGRPAVAQDGCGPDARRGAADQHLSRPAGLHRDLFRCQRRRLLQGLGSIEQGPLAVALRRQDQKRRRLARRQPHREGQALARHGRRHRRVGDQVHDLDARGRCRQAERRVQHDRRREWLLPDIADGQAQVAVRQAAVTLHEQLGGCRARERDRLPACRR